eukprot:4356520-Pyramimonas_sp.AAC.1
MHGQLRGLKDGAEGISADLLVLDIVEARVSCGWVADGQHGHAGLGHKALDYRVATSDIMNGIGSLCIGHQGRN